MHKQPYPAQRLRTMSYRSSQHGDSAMRALFIIGIVLVIVGICLLGFQSATYFTQEHVVGAGPLQVDVQKAHTIVFNPIVALVVLGAGVVFMVLGTRRVARY